MTIIEFTSKVMYLVQYRLGSDYYISTENVTKNNGLTLHGLSIHKKGSTIAPTVYMEQLFMAYEDGISLHDIVENVIRIVMENEKTSFDISLFTDFESVRKKIIFQLVNAKKNETLLKKIPSKNCLDLSIIFRMLIADNPDGTASAIITNKHMKMWGVGVDEIYKTAMENTPILQKAVIRSMDDILSELVDDNDRKSLPLYVLTNDKTLNGCGCILYPHVLEDFGEWIAGNFYILPSSTHEVILLPDMEGNSHDLIQIVREINRTVIYQEDFLSDNVYYFSTETKEITIIQ